MDDRGIVSSHNISNGIKFCSGTNGMVRLTLHYLLTGRQMCLKTVAVILTKYSTNDAVNSRVVGCVALLG